MSPGGGTSGGRCSSGRRGSVASSDLNRDNAAKGTSWVGVGHLDIANVLDISDGASAGNTGWDGKGNGEIHGDVGGPALNHARPLENIPNERLLGDGSWAVAVVAGDILRGSQESALAELSSRCSVQNGLDRTAAIGGDNVEDTGEVTARGDLRESITRKSHCLRDLGGLHLALSGGGTQTITKWLCAAEHCSVELSLNKVAMLALIHRISPCVNVPIHN